MGRQTVCLGAASQLACPSGLEPASAQCTTHSTASSGEGARRCRSARCGCEGAGAGEERVDGGDAIDCGGDRLLHRDPCAFLAGAGRPGAAAEAGGGASSPQQRVAFGVERVEPADVGPVLGLGEFLLEVAQPSPVGRARPVGRAPSPRPGCATGAGCRRRPDRAPATGTDRARRDQFPQVAEAAQRPQRRGGALRARPARARRLRVQMHPAASPGSGGCDRGGDHDAEPVAPPRGRRCARRSPGPWRAAAGGVRRRRGSPRRERVSSVTPWNITAPALNTARPSYGASRLAAFSTISASPTASAASSTHCSVSSQLTSRGSSSRTRPWNVCTSSAGAVGLPARRPRGRRPRRTRTVTPSASRELLALGARRRRTWPVSPDWAAA